MPVERRDTTDPQILARQLQQGADLLGVSLDQRAFDRLLAYLALLRKWNGVYNLTAVRDPQQMLVQHLLDSLAVLPPLRRRLPLTGATIADIGSGAGLPGLVLAIAEPRMHLVSIEPIGKKTAFQQQVCVELGLTNCEILTARTETLRRRADAVVCRAFASLADFVSAAAGLRGPETLLVAMKGQREELDAELTALGPDEEVDVEPLVVPFLDAERHLVFLRRRPAPTARP
jgi:16S rRNA (guanine527-N7)-methyltransferase